MGQVIYFPTGNLRKQDDVFKFADTDALTLVSILEGLLVLARAGQLVHFVVAVERADGFEMHAELVLVNDEEAPPVEPA